MPCSIARPVSTFPTDCTRHPETSHASGRASRWSSSMIAAFAGFRSASARNASLLTAIQSMHRGEEPRQPDTGEPGPYRLAAHAEIPGAEHGVRAADEIVDRLLADAAGAQR